MRLTLAASLLLFATIAQAEDWPQWRGSNSSGNYTEPGLIEKAPEGGLQQQWRLDCGYGYAGPAVAGGKVYLFDYVKTAGEVTNSAGRRDELQGRERLRAIDAKTGNVVWTSEYDRPYNMSYPGGPRCTPTVVGEYVYTLGGEGDLMCHRTSDGERVWHVNFREAYGVETPIWGHSAHPIVVDGMVVAVVGGKDALAVALDAATGTEKWKALNASEPGYCGPSVIEHAGQKQVLIFSPNGVDALDPATGETIWKEKLVPNYGMSIAMPLQRENDLFVSAYGESMMVELGDEASAAKVVWRGKPNNSVYASNVTPYFADDAIYGCDIESSSLVAVDPESAERLWETKEPTLADPDARGARHGSAFIVRHTPSGHYVLFNESGEIIVADLSREKYTELWRAKVLEPTGDAFGRPVVWSHPAYAEGCVYARNDKELVCTKITE